MLQPEWKGRVDHWIHTLSKEFYEPLGRLDFSGFVTRDMLSLREAEERKFHQMPEGTAWGRSWEYGWFRSKLELDTRADGKMIVMDLHTGGEAMVFVNGCEFGTRRAEWVKERHHYICDQILTEKAKSGDRFEIVLEAYAGHDMQQSALGCCATGPIRPGDYVPTDENALRQRVGISTWGIWHEEAYQLWLDVTMLRDLLSVLEPESLRAAEIEEALEQFTLAVDFEKSRGQRIEDYRKARVLLRPVMQAQNGSTAPEMYAVGNAHLDICWLWPYRETERKVARTFAQQLRLMDLYPSYRFIQGQPESYTICKRLYPGLYEKIKKKIGTGQWIADGGMWVEPDTNMTSGESLIRQIVYGKRFFKEEFDVDCQLLWLPDTFGYSAVLPQILKGCGIKYLTTQKILWTYNASERFPYHYFTWQGIDGSEITSFLHMEYESATDAATVSGRWKNRVQRRDISKFLLPFGYGDGGGGPTRDHIENVLREQNLEGMPKVRMESPQRFFEDCIQDGMPKNRYVGELYFQCHRGTYTSQAAIKRGNRKSEQALREAEIWCAAASEKVGYPRSELEQCWKKVLVNQFHDILPGSSIARVYVEAKERYEDVLQKTAEIAGRARKALTNGAGRSYFNSLSWTRKALVRTGQGYGFVTIPPMGATSVINLNVPEHPVALRQKGDHVVLDNGLLRVCLNQVGEVVSCRDRHGEERIGYMANVLRMYKDVPRKFDAWDIDSVYPLSPVDLGRDGTLEITEDTPFRAAVRVTRRFESSTLTQEISLTAEATQIEFHTDVDWHEKHRLLKVDFPTGIHADEAINEIQFGYVKRPTHRSRHYDADRFEVCNHRYTALCDENRGSAVLNESKYGVSQLNDTISLTLLRGATCPDLNADQGSHHFAYAYYLWDGPFAESEVVRAGYEFNTEIPETEGCAEFSLLHTNRENVIVETLKCAEDGSGDLILRLYESKHAACRTELTLNLPIEAAYVCDMLENVKRELTVREGKVELAMRGFELKTLRIRRKPQ